jgi:hypothetical protein
MALEKNFDMFKLYSHYESGNIYSKGKLSDETDILDVLENWKDFYVEPKAAVIDKMTSSFEELNTALQVVAINESCPLCLNSPTKVVKTLKTTNKILKVVSNYVSTFMNDNIRRFGKPFSTTSDLQILINNANVDQMRTFNKLPALVKNKTTAKYYLKNFNDFNFYEHFPSFKAKSMLFENIFNVKCHTYTQMIDFLDHYESFNNMDEIESLRYIIKNESKRIYGQLHESQNSIDSLIKQINGFNTDLYADDVFYTNILSRYKAFQNNTSEEELICNALINMP